MHSRANKILLLVSSLAALALLGSAAVRENWLQEWKRIQRSYAKALPPESRRDFRVQLRQIVVPRLRVSDRCVSCHVGMAPGEQGISGDRVLSKHPNVHHDPADIGCTVCHGGQGRATESAAAHGDVSFWPEPMIPAGQAYAGCGTCHTHLAVPSMARLEQGRALFERSDCLSCHRLDGRGGTMRTGAAGGMEGPDLSRAGAVGFDEKWYGKHVSRSGEPAAAVWRGAVRSLSQDDQQALDIFLSSRVGAPGLIEAKALFHSLGCRCCHKVGGIGGDDGPDLTRVGQLDPGRLVFDHVPGERTVQNYLAEHFRAPGKVVPGSLMPSMGLSETQIEALNLYMFSLRRSELPEAFWPKDRIRAERFGAREFASDGATLYGAFCAACHGADGRGMRYAGMPPFPAIGGRDFLSIASDSFLAVTIRSGRPGRRMPAWGSPGGPFSESEIDGIVRHIRGLGEGTPFAGDSGPRRWIVADAIRGESLYKANCSLCHGPGGEGGEGPALNNQVFLSSASDLYLLETIRGGRGGTSMTGFASGTNVSSALAPSEIEQLVAFIRTWEVKQ